MTERTHYQIVGIDEKADAMQIMEAYFARQVELEDTGDEAEIAQLEHAYAVLSDESTRLAYDAEIGVEPDDDPMPMPHARVEPEPEWATPPRSKPIDIDPDAPTHYDLLGVDQSATAMDIMEAYMSLRETLEEEGNTQQVEQIQSAYAVLSKQERRAQYDAELKRFGLYHMPFDFDEADVTVIDTQPDQPPRTASPSASSHGELIFPDNSTKSQSARPHKRFDAKSAPPSMTPNDEDDHEQ